MPQHASPMSGERLDALPLPGALVPAADRKATSTVLPRVGIFRILVCRPTHSLGNTLLLTPLIREIETIYPGAEVDIVSRTPVAHDIFSRFASVRRVFVLPSRPIHQFFSLAGMLRKIRQTRYDLVIDPDPRSGTGRALLGFARGRYKLGFAGRANRGLTHSVETTAAARHTGKRPVDLLRMATATGASAPFPALEIGLSPAERELGKIVLARVMESAGPHGGGVIGIFANATGHKLLPFSWWSAFLDTLQARYPEHRFIEIVPAFGRSMLDSRYPTYYSSDLRRLAAVLSALQVFIGADCGIMHLACASGVPVTGIFTATEIQEWGPYGPRDHAIDARGLAPEQVAAQVVVAQS